MACLTLLCYTPPPPYLSISEQEELNAAVERLKANAVSFSLSLCPSQWPDILLAHTMHYNRHGVPTAETCHRNMHLSILQYSRMSRDGQRTIYSSSRKRAWNASVKTFLKLIRVRWLFYVCVPLSAKQWIMTIPLSVAVPKEIQFKRNRQQATERKIQWWVRNTLPMVWMAKGS
jgi:hypothetical protein